VFPIYLVLAEAGFSQLYKLEANRLTHI